MGKPVVAILMGSKSDLPILQGAFKVFDSFGVEFTARVLSAHRTPVEAMEFAAGAEAAGIKVIICAAGMAAHLGGVVAAHTTLPVIGLPVASELSTAWMRCWRWSRCLPACRSVWSPRARRAAGTPHCMRFRCWRWAMRNWRRS